MRLGNMFLSGYSDMHVPEQEEEVKKMATQSSVPLPPEIQKVILNPVERMRILANSAKINEFCTSVPIQRYYQSLGHIFEMAETYKDEGDLEKSFVLFVRFVSMVLEEFPKHDHFQSYNVVERQKYQDMASKAITIADGLKKLVRRRYDDEARKLATDIIDKEKAAQDARRAARARRQAQEEKAGGAGPSGQSGSGLGKRSAPMEEEKTAENAGVAGEDQPLFKKPATPVPKTDADEGPSAFKPVPPRSKRPVPEVPVVQEEVTETVALPKDLVSRFLETVKDKVDAKVQAVGLLCGSSIRGRCIVSHVIIPEQEGTADICITKEQQKVSAFQHQNALITLGWIQTKPTETAFFSAMDMHTHCRYQETIPEAVAIVCAPANNTSVIYQLSEYGIKVIGLCKQMGIHNHGLEELEGKKLSVVARHATYKEAFQVNVVDLRNGGPKKQ